MPLNHTTNKCVDALVIVFDVSNALSFQTAKSLQYHGSISGQPRVTVFVGTKSDLAYQRQVPYEEALSYANEVNATYIETSARLNINVDTVFESLAAQLVDRVSNADHDEENDELITKDDENAQDQEIETAEVAE